MQDIVKEAIDKLECIGLNVVVVLSDQGSNFYSLAQRLKVTPDEPWFTHNGRKIFLMFDPPHVIESVRNNLMKYSLRFGEHVASWTDVEAAYARDSALPIRWAPKLTEKHIRPNNFQKMKVKLATQVLSHTVAATICMYVSVGALPSSAMGTAEFIEKFDSIFDCVISSTLHSTKVLKCALSDQTKHQQLMKETIGFIKKLTLQIGPTDYRDQCNVNSDIVKDNATAYVAGYLIYKVIQIHNCSRCTSAIQCNDLDDNRKLLCFFKAFEQTENTFGGLHAPTNCFLDYVMKLEDVFFKNFSIYTKSLTVGKDILMLLNRVPLPFKCCDEFPLEFLQKLFLRLRIYYSLKFANREFANTKKKNRKYLKVAQLRP